MDTISKQRAIDEIRDFQAQITCSFSESWLNGMNEGFDHAVAVIKLMETVEAKPVRHKHWIYGENKDGFDGYRCSGCRKHYAVDDVSDYHYCPNCGARMDGES